MRSSANRVLPLVHAAVGYLKGLAILGAGGILQSCDECDKLGEEWCDGNVATQCIHRRQDFGNVLMSDDCDGRNGQVCVEVDPGRDETRAICAMSSVPCDGGIRSYCDGTWLIDCVEFGYPVVKTDCANHSFAGGFCQELTSGNAAACTFAGGACAPDGSRQCYEPDPSVWLECADGAWQALDRCPQGTSCEQTSTGAIECR